MATSHFMQPLIKTEEAPGDTETNSSRIIEFMTSFDPLAVNWEKIASAILDKITIRQIVLIKAKNDHESTSMTTTFASRLKLVLEELIDELSKISVDEDVPAVFPTPPFKKAKVKAAKKKAALSVDPSDLEPPFPPTESIPTDLDQDYSEELEQTPDPSLFVKQEVDDNGDNLDYPEEEDEDSFAPEPGPSTSQEGAENIEIKGFFHCPGKCGFQSKHYKQFNQHISKIRTCHLCHEEFHGQYSSRDIERHLKKHDKVNQKKKSWICQYCNKDFGRKSWFLKHEKTKCSKKVVFLEVQPSLPQ